MLSNRHKNSGRRRGMILMVVLAMLTLFTIVGITFVFMSSAIALQAQIARDAEKIERPDVDPELALSYVLSQLIYDVNDDDTGFYSALRGHSLARGMYGWNHDPTSTTTYSPNDSA